MSEDSKSPVSIFSTRQQSRLIQTFTSLYQNTDRPTPKAAVLLRTVQTHLTNLPVGIFMQCLTRPSDGVVQSAYVLVATALLRYRWTRRFESFA